MCVWLQKSILTRFTQEIITIGVANVDIYTGRTSINQFEVESFHNPCTYDELERLVTVHRPTECIVVTNMSETIANEIIQFVGLDQCKVHNVNLTSSTEVGELARSAEKQVYQLEVFMKFFPNNHELFSTTYAEHYIAMQSLTLLLDFVYRHSPYLVAKLSIPEFQNNTQRLTLANHSLKQLNILDDTRHSGKLRSVAAFLNNCSTMMGKRRFNHSISNPTTCVKTLENSYRITEHLLKNNDKWNEYRLLLSGVSDMEKLARKIVLKRATPKDLAMLAGDLRRAITLYRDVRNDPVLLDHFQDKDPRPIDALAEVTLAEVEETFDLECCLSIDDLSPDRLIVNPASDGFIRHGKSPPIDTIRELGKHGRHKLEAIKNHLVSCLRDEKPRTSDPVKIHETAKHNPTLQLTQRRARLLKANLAKTTNPAVLQHPNGIDTFEFMTNDLEYRTAGNSKSVYIATNSQIETICAGLQTAKDKLVQEYIGFYNAFLEKFQKLLPEIEAIIGFVTILDIEQCRCYIAHKYNYCRPKLESQTKSLHRGQGYPTPSNRASSDPGDLRYK